MISSASAQFTVGHCDTCAAHVLTYVDLAADGLLINRCLACDAALSGQLRTVPSTELAEHGYEIAEAGGGCGSGCGSSCGVRTTADDTH